MTFQLEFTGDYNAVQRNFDQLQNASSVRITTLWSRAVGPLTLSTSFTPDLTRTTRYLIGHGTGTVSAGGRSGIDIFVNGTLKFTSYLFFNSTDRHMPLPLLFADATAALTGVSTVEIRGGGTPVLTTDANDVFTLAVIEF